MFTIAEVPALCPGTEILAALNARIALAGFSPWADPMPTGDLGYVAVPSFVRPPPPVAVNLVYWPRDAARFAVVYALLDSVGAGNVRSASANLTKPVPVVVTNRPVALPTDEDFKADFSLLRLMPVAEVVAASGGGSGSIGALRNCYVAVLADDRWRWNQIGCPDFAISIEAQKKVTWDDCFAAVEGALGISIAREAIDPSYLLPDPSLNLEGQPAGWVLDALARNVGGRIVRMFDGTVKLMRQRASLEARRADDAAHPDRPLSGGGDGFSGG